MTEKKMTKREYFNRILSYAHDEDKDFILHELELLDRKNSAERKPTPKQIENEGIKTAIHDWMEQGILYSCGEIAKNCPACEGFAVQRVSALLSQMEKSGAVVKTTEKRKTYYGLT